MPITADQDDSSLELVQVEGSPVIPMPAPRDFYKLPNKYKTANDVTCDGLMAIPIAQGDLNKCAKICKKCDQCTGFVDDGDGGKCAYKSLTIDEDCLSSNNCNKDGYQKCPPGKWSDGLTTDSQCFVSPLGYRRQYGNGPVTSGTTDMNCNNGAATQVVSDYNLQTCATTCSGCAVGADKCVGFIRSQPDDGSTGAKCTFKSSMPETAKVKANEDAYRACGAKTWSDGMMEKCGVAPGSYKTKINFKGGNPINCHNGAAEMRYPASGDLNVCGKACHQCTEGTRKCDGFIRREGKCYFMSNTKAPTADNNIVFGSVASAGADAYTQCPNYLTSDGSETKCTFPDDWVAKVTTGSGTDCTCNARSVNTRRFSNSKWTFQLFDQNSVPLFLSGKPEVDAPCANEKDTKCHGAFDFSGRTSSAGTTPKKVRITTDANDDWCMKDFCIASKKLQRHWRTTVTKTQAQYLNPGVTADGTCLPRSTHFPKNNWGWCRFVAGGVQASMSTCNVYNDYKKAYWEFDLDAGAFGDCPDSSVTAELAAAATVKEIAEQTAEIAAEVANGGR